MLQLQIDRAAVSFDSGLRSHLPASGKTLENLSAATIIFLFLAAIAPFASADVWVEAIVFVVIFALAALNVFRVSTISAQVRNRFFFLPLWLLAAYSFLQGLCAILRSEALLGDSPALLPESFNLTASFWNAVKILAFAVFLRLLLENFNRRLKLLTWNLIAVGSFFAFLGIFRFLAQSNYPAIFPFFIFHALRPNIGFATFFNQNHFADLMLMTFGLNIGLLRYLKSSPKTVLLLFWLSVTAWVALLLTASRGAIISSFLEVALLIFLPVRSPFNRRARKWPASRLLKLGRASAKIAAFALISAILIWAIAFIGQDRVVTRFEHLTAQFDKTPVSPGFRRTDVWQAAAKIICDHPLYGVGFSGFRFAVARHIEISGQPAPEQAHNDYLDLAASGGILGVALAVWFLFGFFQMISRNWNESNSRFSIAARVGAICSLAGVAAHSLVDSGLQLTGNLLFLAGLLAIAVHQPLPLTWQTQVDSARRLGDFKLFKWLTVALFIGLIIYSVFFGLWRLRMQSAADESNLATLEKTVFKFPFDADFYEIKGLILAQNGDFSAAQRELQNAIKYRSQDYNLWLKLARIEAAETDAKAAENSFHQAIKLAPFYSAPRYFYGQFLIANNRDNDGFAALHAAFRSNPELFADVLALAWRLTNGNANETIGFLTPLEQVEKEKLADFLLAKNEHAALVKLVCDASNISEKKRAHLTQNLFEKRQFLFAYQIDERKCVVSDRSWIDFADGDFAATARLRQQSGFGWRVGDLPEAVKVSLVEEAENQNRNLAFDFAGDFETGLPLLSQIVIAEKNQQYQFSFEYKSENIVSGGLPVLKIILKTPDDDFIFQEIKFAANTDGWIKSQATIRTQGETEAIEFRLARQSCGETLCPIFGRLQIDNFVLKNK